MTKLFGGLLIGNSTKIVESKDKHLLGITGRIVDETKNTLILICTGSKIVVPKSIVSLELVGEKGAVLHVSGSELIGTPQERLSKL